MTDEETKPSRHWNDQPGSHDRARVDLSSHVRSFWLLQCFAHRKQRPPPKSLPFSCDPLGPMFPRLILSWWRSEFMWKRLVPASSYSQFGTCGAITDSKNYSAPFYLFTSPWILIAHMLDHAWYFPTGLWASVYLPSLLLIFVVWIG